MQFYTLVNVYCPENGQILTVLKDRPHHMRGRLNLVGGKIKEGEEPLIGAKRETLEESGIDLPEDRFEPTGTLMGTWGIVTVFNCPISLKELSQINLKPREGETERVQFDFIQNVLADPRLMQNLKVMIPLLALKVRGWVVYDEGCPAMGQSHQVSVVVEPRKF